ncbi:MAG: multifunctional CCA addition/repair protein [Gammaproteobacteria bacterium]|nr:multifunctional CCA addition/repair protein [Gammaproteobacteria bacterium]MDH5593307.1 multifunctional CCA addition/repair protein [Gammaproteobacteria bacterium]MDH5613760.1 multifunctional CCA addition/repair protein [Gammaproteobacteria bacterium]
MEIYLVGGAVRDKLLGITPKERDWVVVGATPEEMLAQGFQQVGKDFPVFLHPDTKEEYALARTERKTGPGYTGFEVHASPEVTLEEDLKRRDLTINAIAEDKDGNLIDPFNGKEDLDNGLLKHVSSAFDEDPVRILRIARFAARFAKWGFKVSHGTNALMRKMVEAGEVDALVAERVWAELEKVLNEDHPERFFEVLRGCHALAKLFPEIDQLFGVPQPEKYHPEIDTGVHVMMVLQQAARLSDDPVVRFAALTHDLGKGTTPKDLLPKHHGHEGRSVELVQVLCDRFRIPNEYRELAILTARYHTHCHNAEELKPSTLLEVIEAMDAFRRPERFEQFLTACKADFHGRPGYEQLDYPQVDRLRKALEAANLIDAKALVERGLKGEAIKEELRKQRIDAIKQAVS